MKLKKIIIILLAISVLTQLFIFVTPNASGLRVVFGLVYLLLIPGLLAAICLRLKLKSATEWLIYSIGLSLVILLFAGLFINTFLPLLGYDRPLGTLPLSITFDVLILLMGARALVDKHQPRSIHRVYFKPKRGEAALLSIAFSLPFLSWFGANMLNSGGSSLLTMAMLGLSSLLVLGVTIFRKKINPSIFPFILYCLGLAALLMFSLRTQHIVGFDIHEEYQVFQLTLSRLHWSPANLQGNAYNACLSITILPTIMKSILGIGGETIFKFVPQIIFGLTPVILFVTVRRYLNPVKSFFVAFLLISQIWFMLQMPELTRQEIALFLFSLLILVATTASLARSQRKLLFIVFTVALILSHYSTSYIVIMLLVVYGIIRASLYLTKKRSSEVFSVITVPTVIILFLATFFWNLQLTQSDSNLNSTASSISKNFSKIFTAESLQSGADRLLFKPLNLDSPQEVNNTYKKVSAQYHRTQPDLSYYSHDTYADYQPQPKFEPSLRGINNESATFIAGKLSTLTKFLLALVFPLLGLSVLLFKGYRHKRKDANYVLLSAATLPLIAAILFVPFLKVAYNIERVYLQSLILLAYPAIVGAFIFLRPLRRVYTVLAILLVIFFLESSGFITQITGGAAQINLNNTGEGYDTYSTTTGEIYAARWLEANRNKSDPVYADEVANLRLVAYGLTNNAHFDIYPTTIARNGYVYLSRVNSVNDTAYIRVGIGLMTYSYPTNFLNTQKNVIYSSGTAKVMH